MKKIFLTITLLTGCLIANAGVLSLGKTSFEVVAGGTVTIPVQLTFDASEIGYYKNIEFKAVWSGATTNFSRVGATLAESRKVPECGYDETWDLANNIMFVSKLNEGCFVGESGDFCYLTVKADASAAAGTECTLSLNNPFGGHVGDGVETTFSPASVSVTITVVDYVTIDENETFTPFVFSNKDVHLVRSFEADKYYTLILPFGANAAKVATAFGTKPTLYQFTGVTLDSDPNDSGEVTGMTLKFESKNLITAGVPYVIKTSAAVVNPVFGSVSISSDNASKAPVTDVPEEDFVGVNLYLRGSYAASTVIPEGCLYVKSNDGKLYSSTGNVKMKGTRAYFDLTELLNEFSLSEVKMDLDGVLTSIAAIDTDVNAEGWYDMNGRKLAEKPTMKGVYINNGKKVVVK